MALNTHERYMARCLQIAALGAGNTTPNPMVGALLVYQGRIIAEGYHRQFGQAHAEVNCIKNVPRHLIPFLPECTLYVSLEPCNHFGKTPPCSDLIIEKNIPEVVIACSDPFEKVNGGGIMKLKDAGIRVIMGVLEKEAIELNKRFFTFHQRKRPYIILKWAQSNDGRIALADYTPVRISNAFSNRLVHKWRSEEAAIMVGTKTALNDNPALTTRLWPGKNPVRIVVDMNLALPDSHFLFDRSAETIIINAIKQEDVDHLHFFKINDKNNLIGEVMQLMWRKNLVSLIVEGGAELINSFISSGYWDEARVITNTSMDIGTGIKAPVLQNETLVGKELLQDDVIMYYRNLREL